MATIKSYTDLEQSKKLAEILSIESADMCYKCIGEDPYDVCLRPYSEWKEEYKGLLVGKEVDVIPCWSLSALISVLPNTKSCHYNETYFGQYMGIGDEFPTYNTMEYNNPVDACYEMILKLHELNLL